MPVTKQEALEYHEGDRPGKVEVVSSKPCRTQRDLSLAYTPGVAIPCLEIEKNPLDAYRYTAKGNLVAVVSNGTAVLGLGDIGALAGKPVMEGKGVLFKRFADIDVFDIELNTHNADEIIKTNEVQKAADELGISLQDAVIVEPEEHPRFHEYVQEFYRLRQRKGVTLAAAEELMHHRNIFGAMMVRMGDADALVSGVSQNYPDTLRPALQVIGVREGIHKVSGIYLLITRRGDLFFLADATVNIEPSAEDLAEIALCAAQEARRFDLEPRIAMLSFSTFGSTRHPLCDKVSRAVELVRYADPTLIIEGELQSDMAVNAKKLREVFPFSRLKGGGNVLIFPDLQSCNIAARLLPQLGAGQTLGPILSGMAKPVHLLQRGAEVEDVVNIAAVAVVDAQDSFAPARTQSRVAVAFS